MGRRLCLSGAAGSFFSRFLDYRSLQLLSNTFDAFAMLAAAALEWQLVRSPGLFLFVVDTHWPIVIDLQLQSQDPCLDYSHPRETALATVYRGEICRAA
jgi:hypothetical protein